LLFFFSVVGYAGELTLVEARPADGEPPLVLPFGVDWDAARSLYVVELEGNRVRKIDTRGVLTTIAGTGRKGSAGDGGSAHDAELNGPHMLAFGPDGALYVADTWNNRVRRIDLATGEITTFAGTGEKGFGGDGGPASQATFGGIYSLSFSPDQQSLYLADLDNRRIRKIDMTTSTVTTVAGNGQRGVPKDGSKAVSSPLVDPRAVAADQAGNVYILERGGHALRGVDREGTIRTLAGTGTKGMGPEGPALACAMNGPKHLCIDRDGNVIIADAENHRILKYDPSDGCIIRVAGNDHGGAAGLGRPPVEAALNRPHGVAFDRRGVLFIADSWNNRLLKLE